MTNHGNTAPEPDVESLFLLGGGRISQALSIYDDANMGIFTNAGPQGELISLLRAREVFSRAGATGVTLPPNGVLPVPKQTSAATAFWLGRRQRPASATRRPHRASSIPIRSPR